MVMGAGPFDLVPAGEVAVIFALVGGTGKQALLAHAAAARYLISTDVVSGAHAPRYVLAQNYPNPFNPTTTIRFGLARRGHVMLRVFDVAGRLVRRLVDEELEARWHAVQWDGLDGRGRRVPSGVYFYRLVATDYSATRKMLVVK